MLDLKQSTVSYHLKQLLDAGIVEREKRGSFAYFSHRARRARARLLAARLLNRVARARSVVARNKKARKCGPFP